MHTFISFIRMLYGGLKSDRAVRTGGTFFDEHAGMYPILHAQHLHEQIYHICYLKDIHSYTRNCHLSFYLVGTQSKSKIMYAVLFIFVKFLLTEN